MRLACVYVPQLALQSALRRDPEARALPSALLATDGKRKPRVTEIDPAARRAGVRPGMTAAQAAAICPGIRLLNAAAADRDAGAAALATSGSRLRRAWNRRANAVFGRLRSRPPVPGW